MSSRSRKKQASLNRRKNRQKAKRLATAAEMLQLRQGLESLKADTNIRMVRTPENGVALGVRHGLIGHPQEVVLQVTGEKIVGGVEDVQELAEVVNQVGLLTLASLLRFNLADGPEELARALARWAGIDLKALKAAAEVEEKDEDGDIVVRTVEEGPAAIPAEVPVL